MFLEHFQGRWNESLTKLLKRKGGGRGEGKIIILFDKHAIEADCSVSMILSNGESGQTYLCDSIVNLSERRGKQ